MTQDSHPPLTILLVEDSPTDALLAREALNYAKVLNELHIVETGEEALAFLHREGRYADAPLPGLILLDWKLPGISGEEVLRQVKNDERFMAIPVVVLTTSNAEEDVLKSYRLHANCFVCKPMGFDSLADVVKQIGEFWFSVVTLPQGGKG